MREIGAADVKPNTFVRMARQVGFEGHDDFRAPFRETIRHGTVPFPDRARWLQDIGRSGELGGLYTDMGGAAIRNIGETYAGISADAPEAAARATWNARQVFTGTGNTRVVVCPYHAWTSELTGQLRAGPNLKPVPGFDRSDICLTQVRAENFHGFLFVNLDDAAAPMEDRFPGVREELAAFIRRAHDVDSCTVWHGWYTVVGAKRDVIRNLARQDRQTTVAEDIRLAESVHRGLK